MGNDINIIVNGFTEAVPENTTIRQLIVRFREGDPDLIVEHNGCFVYRKDYHATTVFPGDRIEFIRPNFGG